MITRMSPNCSPKSLVFGDVNVLLKFEGHHIQPKQFATGTHTM